MVEAGRAAVADSGEVTEVPAVAILLAFLSVMICRCRLVNSVKKSSLLLHWMSRVLRYTQQTCHNVNTLLTCPLQRTCLSG